MKGFDTVKLQCSIQAIITKSFSANLTIQSSVYFHVASQAVFTVRNVVAER